MFFRIILWNFNVRRFYPCFIDNFVRVRISHNHSTEWDCCIIPLSIRSPSIILCHLCNRGTSDLLTCIGPERVPFSFALTRMESFTIISGPFFPYKHWISFMVKCKAYIQPFFIGAIDRVNIL